MSVTIGILISEAIALGAKEFGKTVVGEVAKDSYKQLKDRLAKLIGMETVDNAGDANSDAQTRLADKVDNLASVEREQLKGMLAKLAEEVARANVPQSIGQRFREIKTEVARVNVLNVKGAAVGQQIDRLEAHTFEIGELNVGDSPSGKPRRQR